MIPKEVSFPKKLKGEANSIFFSLLLFLRKRAKTPKSNIVYFGQETIIRDVIEKEQQQQPRNLNGCLVSSNHEK